MKIEEILHLVEAVSNSALTEFKYEEGAVKLALRKTISASVQTVASAPVSVQPIASTAGTTQPEVDGAAVPEKKITEGRVIKSPLVGTFYAAPSEDAAPFVKVGESVKEGQVIAIVEAMKLMNDIESDFTGTVVEVLVENGETVEFGQPLFVIS